jgi:hypothetical protein
VNTQRFEHNVSLWALRDVVARFPHHPGAKRLHAVVQAAPDEPYRSEWEMDWPSYARRHGITAAYDMNVPLARGVIADVVVRPRLVIIELDGWGPHGIRSAFERDRRRDREVYAKLGIPTFRITRSDVMEQPAETAATLNRVIARRRRERGVAPAGPQAGRDTR